jgi:hypothetical protein
MTEFDAEEYFHQQIPITRAMGVRVVVHNENEFIVEAPVALNSNHLGTAGSDCETTPFMLSSRRAPSDFCGPCVKPSARLACGPSTTNGLSFKPDLPRREKRTLPFA